MVTVYGSRKANLLAARRQVLDDVLGGVDVGVGVGATLVPGILLDFASLALF